MNLYLASSFGNKALMCENREKIQAHGHFVTSRWLDEADDKGYAQLSQHEQQLCAIDDMRDIMRADAVVLFTGPLGSFRGGCHVESGIALGSGKQLIVVGSRGNNFHFLKEVRHFETIYELIAWLRDRP